MQYAVTEMDKDKTNGANTHPSVEECMAEACVYNLPVTFCPVISKWIPPGYVPIAL